MSAPDADLAEGTYSKNKSVSLKTKTANADIYYTMTTDGTDPSDPAPADTKYTGAIALTGTEGSSITYKIKAVAVKEGTSSDIASFTYTIAIPEKTPAVPDTDETDGGSVTDSDGGSVTDSAAGSAAEGSGKDDVPKTGNTTPVTLLFVLMLGSGITLYLTSKRKLHKNK